MRPTYSGTIGWIQSTPAVPRARSLGVGRAMLVIVMLVCGAFLCLGSVARGAETEDYDWLVEPLFGEEDLIGRALEPHNLHDFDGTLYFLAHTAEAGREVWRSDGTTSGTMLVHDLYPGPSDSEARFLGNAGGQMYYAGLVDQDAFGIFRFDGVTTETIRLNEPSDWWRTLEFVDYNDELHFVTADAKLSKFTADGDIQEIWRSTETDAASDGKLLLHEGYLYFQIDEAFWRSNGQLDGTELLFELPIITYCYRWGPYHWMWRCEEVFPTDVKRVAVGNQMLVAAHYHLWDSSGWTTQLNTSRLYSVPLDKGAGVMPDEVSHPESRFYGAEFKSIMAGDTTAFLLGEVNRRPFIMSLISNGTTIEHETIFDFASAMAYIGGRAIILTSTSLAITDGTLEGTTWINQRRVSNSTTPRLLPLNPTGGEFCFFARDYISGSVPSPDGYELWKSDGTTTGTLRVADLVLGPEDGTAHEQIVSGNHLFFTATVGDDDRLLYALTTDSLLDTTPTLPLLTEPESTFGAFTVSVDFGQEVRVLREYEIEVENGVLCDLVDLGGGRFTIKVTPTSELPVDVWIPADVVRDSGANFNLASNVLRLIPPPSGWIVR